MTGTRITLPEDFNVEERVERAKANFKAGYNCCQSVVLAYNDLFGMDTDTAAALTSGFGGGMGRLREVCGSVTGMFFMAGMITPATDPQDKPVRTANYALVQDFAARFKEENGSIICRELLGLSGKKESPEPSDRTQAYYKKRPCAELVGMSARFVGEKLMEMK